MYVPVCVWVDVGVWVIYVDGKRRAAVARSEWARTYQLLWKIVASHPLCIYMYIHMCICIYMCLCLCGRVCGCVCRVKSSCNAKASAHALRASSGNDSCKLSNLLNIYMCTMHVCAGFLCSCVVVIVCVTSSCNAKLLLGADLPASLEEASRYASTIYVCVYVRMHMHACVCLWFCGCVVCEVELQREARSYCH